MNTLRRYFGPTLLALGLVLALVLSTSAAGGLASLAGRAQDTPSPIATPTTETEPGEDAAPADAAQGSVAQPGGDLPGDPAIQLIKVAEGFADPINVVSPPDGSGRLFVIERPGIVRIVSDGQIVEEPFLDLSDVVLSAFLEQGFYDLEFHPDYAENGLFYVHFAELLRNGDSMIVEYQVSADNPDLADPASARVLLQIEQPWANHNGGELAFGPDGYLYIGSGDGGWEGDPLEAGQDLSTLLGKILRIDVNVQGNQPYAIPEDNPFSQPVQLVELFGIPESEFAQIHTEARPEIWAYGLRNPWKFSFDSQTGDLYIADVGQNEWEEINFQPADSTGGENYGWDFNMGSHCFPIEQEECPQVGVLPAAEYSHDLGSAVIGIGVYRGGEFAALDGIYFAGDYGSGRVWGLAQDDQGEWAFEELLDTALLLTGAGEDENGDLYVTSCNCQYGDDSPFENEPGALWRVVAADAVPEGAETAPVDDEDPDPDATGTPVTGETPEATGTPVTGETPEATGTPVTGETPEATGTPGSTEPVTIQLTAQNNAFNLDTITVPAGAHVVIEFTNLDSAPHNFAAYVTEAAEEEVFRGEVIAGPDETITYEFDAPSEPGTYFFRCDIHPQIMVGDLIVE